MTGTYRQTVVFTYDGFEHTRRRAKTRSKLKPIDRRIKRREHHDIVSKAVRSFYVDGADDFYDFMNQYAEENWYDDEPMWPYEEEEYFEDYHAENDYEYDDGNYYDDGWASYHYVDEHYVWGTRKISPEDARRIEPEDIGKSLGEILQAMLDKRSGF